MKKILFLVTLIALLSGPLFSQTRPRKAPRPAAPAPAADADSADQLRKRLQQVMNAWSAMDPDAAARFYAKDADLVFFDLTPLQYKGWDEYYLGTKKLFANYTELNIRLRDDAHVHFRGDMAYATAIWDVFAQLADGSKQELALRWTVILERRDGEWLVVHEHVSAPLPDAPPKPSRPQPAAPEEKKKEDPYK
ncbi:MAG TPA: SgcJ/EcaC family oxidoreductase [Terriglobales bacterium]|nr:SgcJ/EcaC family oxidoreductase [Terriglobales bacterium]